MKKNSLICMLILLSFMGAQAQEDSYKVIAGNTDTLLYNYFMERLQTQFEHRRKAVKKTSRSEKGVLKRRDLLRARYNEMIGELPSKCPLNPKVTRKISMDSFTVEAVTFESRPNHHVTGLFYLPKKGRAPYPAVYIPCGHSLNGKAMDSYQKAARLFALNGFAVLQADPICQGERFQLLDANGKPETRGGTLMHEFFGQAMLLTGTTPLVHELYDNIRCLDFLEQHPAVDKNRIAVSGNSGGGTQSVYLAAYDRRIKAAAPSCYVATAEQKFKNPLVPDWCQRLWGEGYYGIEEQDFLLMAAPTPIRILSADQDFFDIRGARVASHELKNWYTIMDIGENTSHSICEGPHGWHKPLREAAVQWCKRWLMHDDSPVIEPEDIGFFQETEILATPTGQVLSSFDNERSMFDIIGDKVSVCRKERATFQEESSRKEIIKKIVALIGYEEPRKNTRVKNTGMLKEEGYRVEKLLLERDFQRNFSLPALLFIPDGAEGNVPASVMVSSNGKKSLLDSESKLYRELSKGRIVLAVDITDSGELEDGMRKTVGKSTVFTPKFPLYEGKTLIGYRTEDIVVATRFLRKHSLVDKKQITLVSKGNTSYSAIHAAAVSGYFNRVEVIGEMKSWETIATESYSSQQQLWRLVNIVPDVLNYYDVPDLKNICIEKNIKIVQKEEQELIETETR